LYIIGTLAYRAVHAIIATENIVFETGITQPFRGTTNYRFITVGFSIEIFYEVEPPPSSSIEGRTSSIPPRRWALKGLSIKTWREDLVFHFVTNKAFQQLTDIRAANGGFGLSP
jgi:hypothetical protein